MAAEDAASADPPRPSSNAESQQWAIQRRIDDVFAKLGEKFGNLTGRVVVQMKPVKHLPTLLPVSLQRP